MAQTVLALVLPRRHNQNMGGKKKNRRAESRPTGGADPVVTSTPVEGSEPAVTYLSAPDSRSSQSLADLARGNDATVRAVLDHIEGFGHPRPVRVAVNCSWGKHRSVAFVELLRSNLEHRHRVFVTHMERYRWDRGHHWRQDWLPKHWNWNSEESLKFVARGDR